MGVLESFARTPGTHVDAAAHGGAPGGAAAFAMVHRGAGPLSKGGAVGIHFSNDSVHWTAPVPLPGLAAWSNYSQAPGLIAVPGGLVLSHGGRGKTATAGSGRLGATAGHGDSNGVDLFTSKDGLNWSLRRHVWPFTGGYSSMVETTTDADGGRGPSGCCSRRAGSWARSRCWRS